MDDWLKSMLVDAGHMSESGLTATARIRAHRRCGLPCIAGYDAKAAAFDAWCDPSPLSAHGEAEAAISGRRTYSLAHGTLRPRNRWDIPAHPAGAKGSPVVLAEHRCDQPVPAAWTTPPSTPRTAPAATRSDECPF